MKTALTCALLAISFLGRPCSSSEGGGVQASGIGTTTDLYERHYRNNSGLCGAQYRNSSFAEPVYNCTLKALPHIVNQTWEKIRHDINKTIPEFVKLMCNFVSRHQLSVGNSYYGEDDHSTDYDEEKKKVSAAAVTAEQITQAEENCTAQITGWTTEAPTTLEPAETPQPEAIP
ncbi:20 kDa salivary gland protein, putative [Ixodes scapularis]|uniref:20 kDa salivary gland protein, putative n=1 Tax=Ixodes scapularis TaxID=6945 RepID=B7P6S1_IXOSC|nr:20 kDa salivary gland protein, putative [Ixodes scapularis]|eukprot:XP_002409169.1 20 kDa salivary gland protein, putative [Ixodes scapularis]